MMIYVVRSGDTVYSIARSHGLDPARVALDNEVPSDGALAVGQTLVLRFPRQIHTVSPGETLASIAQRYGLSVRRLLQNNFFLGGKTTIYPGQELAISYEGEQKLGVTAVNGYAYPFIDRSLLYTQLPYQTYLTPFTYGITVEGDLLPLNDEDLLAAARSLSVAPMLHLSTLTEDGGFSSERAVEVLLEEASRDRLISQVVQTVRAKAYHGVDVDFEYVPSSAAEAYVSFLFQLRAALSPRPLWAALAPKTSANQRGLLYEAHNYAAIGAAVDAVLLMTYEWGYTAGPPMAVAPLPNVRAVLDYAVTEIPPAKIDLGLPNYGYDWPLPFQAGVTRARSLSNREAIALAVRWGASISYDETAQAPWFRYTDDNGATHEVWFEDARSLEAKLRLIASYGFRGTGIWNLMRPFSQLWLVLASLYDILPG